MKVIEYRAVYEDGQYDLLRVRARDINSGFSKALKLAKEPLGSGRVREINRIEFWKVIS